MEESTQDDLFLANSLLKCGQAAEASTYVKKILEKLTEFDLNFISLFSDVYKTIVAPLRDALRRLDSELNGLITEKKSAIIAAITPIRTKTFEELKEKCQEAITLIEKQLLPSSKDSICLALLNKTKADFYRYFAEFSEEVEKNDAISHANNDYTKAMEICSQNLNACDPVSLDVHLNFAVFQYEQLRAPKQALNMLRKVLRDAELELGSLPEKQQKDALVLLSNIRTNIGLWENDDVDI